MRSSALSYSCEPLSHDNFGTQLAVLSEKVEVTLLQVGELAYL